MDPADDELAQGRALTRTNLWRIVWVSAVVAALSARIVGPVSWLRLAVIALVSLLVYRGLRGALWVLGVLTVFAGAGMAVVALVRTDMRWADRLLFGGLGVVQVLAFVILLKAPEVQRFMAHQRTRAGGGPGSPTG